MACRLIGLFMGPVLFPVSHELFKVWIAGVSEGEDAQLAEDQTIGDAQ